MMVFTKSIVTEDMNYVLCVYLTKYSKIPLEW
jgi:hypothetical protein